MKKIPVILIGLLVLCLVATSCRKKAAPLNKLIITTIYPYELLVKQLVGDAIEVRCLVPPNSSPHTWSPNPADLKDLEDAGVIIANGLGLETHLMKSLTVHKGKLIEISSLIDIENQIQHDAEKEAEPQDEPHQPTPHPADEHHHEGMNPHIWLSPDFLMLMTTSLSDLLLEKYPEFRSQITANTQIMIRELQLAHAQIKAEVQGFPSPALITYHNSFSYFADEFGIEVIGSIQTSPGQEPTLKELSMLSAKIREYQLKAITTEPQMNPKPAEELAKRLNLVVIQLDPLGTSLPIKTISELLIKNWEIMKPTFTND
ncbi:MAG: metal ABC transporter substrate-binding protein [Candidatus Cloacimonetes bacterium]|nr:metal ABC transporter substrate-binding protein [Candidatus Cloacimonadota bacterium]